MPARMFVIFLSFVLFIFLLSFLWSRKNNTLVISFRKGLINKIGKQFSK